MCGDMRGDGNLSHDMYGIIFGSALDSIPTLLDVWAHPRRGTFLYWTGCGAVGFPRTMMDDDVDAASTADFEGYDARYGVLSDYDRTPFF